MNILKKKPVTNAEAKRLLESAGQELTPLQRVVLDYTSKFSRISAEEAAELVRLLMSEAGIDEATAVQMGNCVPTSIEEVRTVLGRQRIISEVDLNKIVHALQGYKKSDASSPGS